MRAILDAPHAIEVKSSRKTMRLIHRVSGILLAGMLLVPFGFAQSTAAPGALEAAIGAEFDAADGKEQAAAKKYLLAAQTEKRADYAERAAKLALFARDFALAEQAAEAWLAIKPDQLEAQQTQAYAELAQGKTDANAHVRALLLASTDKSVGAAIGILNAPDVRSNALALLKALKNDPELLALAPDRGLIPIALRLKQNKLALRLARQSTDQLPDSSKAWLWRGLAEIAQNDKAAARISYEKALKLDPKNVPLRLGYVQILNDLKQVQDIDAALQAAPVQNEAILRARIAFASANSDEKALKALNATLKKSSKQIAKPLRQLLRAQIFELLDQPKKALAAYAKVDKNSPEWADAQLRLAVLLAGRDVKKPNLKAARKILAQMQASDLDKAATISAYLLEAELLSEQKQYQQADAVLSAGLARFDDDAGMLYARAMAALARKDIARMEADFRQIVALDPENANAWNALGYSLLTETDRTEEAMAMIERAYTLDPKSGAIADSFGWGFFKMGQVDQAIYYLREAYKLEPDAEIAAHLAEALHSLGAEPEAIKVLREAAAKYPNSSPLQETIKRLKLSITPLTDAAKSADESEQDADARGHEHRE